MTAMIEPLAKRLTRRHFLASNGVNLGAAALCGLSGAAQAAGRKPVRNPLGGLAGMQTIAPKAKRVIYLFQSGGPSQLDLLDYKPLLKDRIGEDLPESVRMGQRLTGFTKNQKTLPVVPSKFKFSQHGESGQWLSEVLPHIGQVADDLCIVNSLHTEAINHDPARMLMQTGSILAGRPGMGAWVSYGLGAETQELPAFLVLISHGAAKRNAQPVSVRLWSSGFLPSQYQGVKLQSVGDPILYLSNPPGLDAKLQQRSIDAIGQLNRINGEAFLDPEIEARVQQYEMAFRMQASVPGLIDLSQETEATFRLYGDEARTPGTYAAHCLLARRMVEQGVRFIQLYHVDWDHHENVPRDTALQSRDVDRATAGLIMDLKQRGLLDETLIVFGGEFGRTVFSQGKYTADKYGRDHHGRCFSMFFAGGGIRGGLTYGATDDFGYSVVENPVHVHDVQATILHLLGIDHTNLTYRFQGREFRLTDVHGKVVHDILA